MSLNRNNRVKDTAIFCIEFRLAVGNATSFSSGKKNNGTSVHIGSEEVVIFFAGFLRWDSFSLSFSR